MAKLATNIKNNDQTELSIDQILNLIESPAPSTSFTSAVASFWNKKNPNQVENDQSFSHLNKMRNSFKNTKHDESTSPSSSFEDHSNTTNRALAEHKIKVLESNFNQIALAYHSDESVLKACIDIYKDKYKRSSSHMGLIFEEIHSTLNRLVSFLNEEIDHSSNEMQQRFSIDLNQDDLQPTLNSNKYSDFFNTKSTSIESNASFSEIPDSNTHSNYLNLVVTQKNKRFLQENLNCLNNGIFQLKSKMDDLITTSSMISGLKQVCSNNL